MLKDGFYRVFFGGNSYTSTSIFVMKAGELVGYSFQGSEYSGCYTVDPVRNLVHFDITAIVPPGVTLVTGHVIGSEVTTVKITGEAPVPNPTTRFNFDLGGKSVDVAVHYIRPLL